MGVAFLACGDGTGRVGSGREGRASDAGTRESRRARIRFGRCAFARSIRTRKESPGRRGRIARSNTHRLLRLFRGGGFLLRPGLLRALGACSGWEDSNVSVRAEAKLSRGRRRDRGPTAARTCLMMSSRETSILVGPSTAPMVKPPRESPLKAIARAGRRAWRVTSDARVPIRRRDIQVTERGRNIRCASSSSSPGARPEPSSTSRPPVVSQGHPIRSRSSVY